MNLVWGGPHSETGLFGSQTCLHGFPFNRFVPTLVNHPGPQDANRVNMPQTNFFRSKPPTFSLKLFPVSH